MKRISKLMSWLLVLALVLSLVPTSQVEAAKKVKVKKVAVSSSLSGSTKTVVVAKGKKVKLKTTVTVTPNKAANKKVSYASKNKKIATVDKKGQIKGVSAGKTTITVTSQKDKKKKAKITVKVVKGAVTKVTLDKTSGTINVGEKVALKATVKAKKGADKTIVWKSSKESVAAVNAKGEVTAVAVGTATITAQAIDGSGKKATYTVTVQDPVVLKNVKVLNERSVAFSLNKAFPLTAGAVSVMKKVYASGTYRNKLDIANMTTTDNINYTVVLGGDSYVSLSEYVQVSIPSLTGAPKAMETQYTEAVAAYIDYEISEWTVGKYNSQIIDFKKNDSAYASFSINKLPAGLTAESKNGYLYVKGTPTAAGKTDAVVTAIDELGNTLTKNVSFIVGSSSVIVGAAAPVYGVCAGGTMPTSVYAYPQVTGGSGSYRYQVVQDPKTIVSYIDSDGELECKISAAGEYSVTVRVTDTQTNRNYDIVIPIKIAQGIVISGYVTDLKGNKIPADSYAEISFTNKNKADLYCPYEGTSTYSDGAYSIVVAPGTYDIQAVVNDNYSNAGYLNSQSFTATRSNFNIAVPLNRIVLTSNNSSVAATAFGNWYDENDNYCGYGNVVWLPLGAHTLRSTKSGRRTITATVNVNVTAATTTAIASVTITENVAGTIVAETPLSVTVSGDYKYYVFKPTKTGTYHFWSEGGEDVEGILEDVNGEELEYDDDYGPSMNFYFSYNCTAGQTYYVGIRLLDEGTATATLKVSETNPRPFGDNGDDEED